MNSSFTAMILKKATKQKAVNASVVTEPPTVSFQHGHYRVNLNGRFYSRHKDSCFVRYSVMRAGGLKYVWTLIVNPKIIAQVDELIKEFVNSSNG